MSTKRYTVDSETNSLCETLASRTGLAKSQVYKLSLRFLLKLSERANIDLRQLLVNQDMFVERIALALRLLDNFLSGNIAVVAQQLPVQTQVQTLSPTPQQSSEDLPSFVADNPWVSVLQNYEKYRR